MKENIHVEKYLSASISLIGLYSSLTHTYENEVLFLFIMYYVNDLKKKTITKDFIIHHLLGMCISCVGIYTNYNRLPTEQNRQLLLHMELTTPLYILSFYYDKLKILFFVSFFYCRIYMQYKILNDTVTYNEFKSMPMKLSYSMYIIYSGLFALNLYWFMLMIKKLSKPFKDSKYIFCHKIIPFIRPINLNLINFYSTISTYLYHEDIYTAIMNDTNMEKYTSPQTMVYSFVNSVVSISSIEPRYYKYSIAVHACKLFIPRMNLSSFLDIIPIGVDTCFYYSSDALIVYYIFILVHTIKPFYNLNPLAIHILLFILRSFRKV